MIADGYQVFLDLHFGKRQSILLFRAQRVQYQIPRVVLAEAVNYPGAVDLLEQHKVQVVNLQDGEMTKIMSDWISSPEGSKVWWEDIGLKQEEAT